MNTFLESLDGLKRIRSNCEVVQTNEGVLNLTLDEITQALLDLSVVAHKLASRCVYTGILLHTKSRITLLMQMGQLLRRGEYDGEELSMNQVAHHVTVSLGYHEDSLMKDTPINTVMDVRVTHWGRIENRVIAVKVDGCFETQNGMPHITVALADGVRPVESNDIEEWTPFKDPFHIEGVMVELES